MPQKTKTLPGSDSVESSSRRKSGPSFWLLKTEL